MLRRFSFRSSAEGFERAYKTGDLVPTWRFDDLEIVTGERIEGACTDGAVFILEVASCDSYPVTNVPDEVSGRLGFANHFALATVLRDLNPGLSENERVFVICYKVLGRRGVP